MLFFKNKKHPEQAGTDKTLKKQAMSLPRRKTVQFEVNGIKTAELSEMLQSDLRNTLTRVLEPANYYKDKKSWYGCEMYYNDDYSTVYVQLVLLVGDRPANSTDFYPLDYELTRDLLRRFGQYI